MWDRSLPKMRFNFLVGDFPRTVPKAVYETLAMNGRPQQMYIDQVRQYSKNKNLENQKLVPHLRIAAKFVNIEAEDWEVLFGLIGPEEASRYIEGCPPPRRVWETLKTLSKEGDVALEDYLRSMVFDLIEQGEPYTLTYFSPLYTINAIKEADAKRERDVRRPAPVAGVPTLAKFPTASSRVEKPPF